MSSEKQIEANRANAQKSTGPRTEGGKTRSRANAWKHGLSASMLVAGGEEVGDFEDLRTALMDHHDPQSTLECELVERVAGILWRLRRAHFHEAAIIDAGRHNWIATQRLYNFKMLYRTPQEFEGDENDIGEMPEEEWSIYVGSALIQNAVYGNALGNLRPLRGRPGEVARQDAASPRGREPAKLEVVARSAAA